MWLAALLLIGFESVPIAFRHHSPHTEQKHLPETMGSGVAIVDIDRDGRPDVFFVDGQGAHRLYRNRGNWRFEDVTQKWRIRGEGFAMGVAAGDYDNDGRTDLYVTAVGRNYLYRNTGSTLQEVAERAGVKASGWSAGAAFFDYDRDGKLDLFVSRYLDWDLKKSRWCGEGEGTPRSYCHPREFGRVSHLLFRNRGNGTFEDVSQQAGIAAKPGKGLGIKIEDVNNDRWPDILVANDSAAQQLFVNRTGKAFEEAALRSGIAFDDNGAAYAGMGIDVADVDGNGTPDVFINALARQGYWLYRNEGSARFEPVTGLARMTDMHSGWGTRLADFDNDGWPDLVVAQGHVMDTIEWSDPAVSYLEPPLLGQNLFGRFFNVSSEAGRAFSEPRAGRGLAVGDLDGDGRLDIVINNNNSGATLLRNVSSSENHWIAVRLHGTKSNRDGYGAEVTAITTSGRRLRSYADSSGSYLSSSDPLIHFGLGPDEAQQINVVWPSGATTVWRGPASDGVLTLLEGR